ncbi:hypothetical protein JQ559_19470 [Bradyrhizobium viridifuturi]|jgi:hypothetical protein|uniref:hypothetical protein n=1 Tax=Bradyrhizobium TaxID=374 RepID=UPI000395FD9A|nr:MULTISPECIES: hypothetical protein [Bradyrhizobium]ERF81676.1 MAG: hypothetical protein C207_05101 [Bradyrhizobium sp. DFCI-1]OYU62181.1 MAG: hypothetical protein CFE30_11520 [Bradyrhizobium sp. PARBB1]PSO18541.1 hypothetical protein C7G43_31215 [Bradyrhizobium sp. MOS004]QRI68923.1 hypothetical protein JQ507_29210 [Bradyrhizobium sp. PSBB068]MBR1022667.1 hypothetical protein [Bradyrhizobium viridifuturi]
MNEVFRRVEERLRPWARGTTITPHTELYGDLGIYGDDFALDVVLWATREFCIEGKVDLSKYAPGEYPFKQVRDRVRRLLGIEPRVYQSFKVSDVVAAIEAERWPD